jgi:hypothetical protein
MNGAVGSTVFSFQLLLQVAQGLAQFLHFGSQLLEIDMDLPHPFVRPMVNHPFFPVHEAALGGHGLLQVFGVPGQSLGQVVHAG